MLALRVLFFCAVAAPLETFAMVSELAEDLEKMNISPRSAGQGSTSEGETTSDGDFPSSGDESKVVTAPVTVRRGGIG